MINSTECAESYKYNVCSKDIYTCTKENMQSCITLFPVDLGSNLHIEIIAVLQPKIDVHVTVNDPLNQILAHFPLVAIFSRGLQY